MSGIYIPGLAMPTNCLDCHVYWDKCPNWDAEGEEYSERIHPDYPLIPVPDHGRLIDADALKVKAIERSEKCGVCVNVLDKVITAYDIETAPTIIPAEEGEK